jgi:hypothetical protein
MTGLLIAGMGDARFCVCLGVGRYFPQVAGADVGFAPSPKAYLGLVNPSRLSLNHPALPAQTARLRYQHILFPSD